MCAFKTVSIFIPFVQVILESRPRNLSLSLDQSHTKLKQIWSWSFAFFGALGSSFDFSLVFGIFLIVLVHRCDELGLAPGSTALLTKFRPSIVK